MTTIATKIAEEQALSMLEPYFIDYLKDYAYSLVEESINDSEDSELIAALEAVGGALPFKFEVRLS